ncbi:MAG: DNA polymerase Y family protein [Pseudomonadota bacterium]
MPPARRILSLWLPRFAAEWRAKREGLGATALAVVGERGGRQEVVSLTEAAEAEGVARGMGLTDARAMAPDILTRTEMTEREAAAMAALARWAERWSPFVAIEDARDGLALDATGCAHLFGGEEGMMESVVAELARLGYAASAALADTRGAAWALARYGAAPATGATDGDAIAPDAHATRVKTPKRRKWSRPEARPDAAAKGGSVAVAPPNGSRAAISPLPVAALRLPPETVTRLQRLGLRRIEDLLLTPRAGLARRFGVELPQRIDQALGMAPEPISPLRFAAPLAARISFPEPIGLASDIEAAMDRLLARLAERMKERAVGARRLRLALRRVDGGAEALDVALARPTRDAHVIAPLFLRKLDQVEAGFGIDAMRMSVTETEPLALGRHLGHMAARAEGAARLSPGGGEAFADLLSRIGGRIGLERLTRPIPAESHIPEKAWSSAAAAYSTAPVGGWPRTGRIRPIRMFAPEPIEAEGRPPRRIRWRGRDRRLTRAAGPERIAPEWWLDDPAWRTGLRDYWRVEDEDGARIWLFQAHGGEMRGGWFVHGELA